MVVGETTWYSAMDPMILFTATMEMTFLWATMVLTKYSAGMVLIKYLEVLETMLYIKVPMVMKITLIVDREMMKYKEQAHLMWTLYRIVRKLNLTNRSEEHTSELQSQSNLVCRLLLEKKKKKKKKK